MNIKELIIRIKKKLKVNDIKRYYCESKRYLSISKKYTVFSGKLVSFNDLNVTDIVCSRNVTLFNVSPVFSSRDSSISTNGMTYVQYVVHLKNATVLGDSNLIVLSSGSVLYDLPFYDVEKRYLYTDHKILKLKDKKVTYWKGLKQTIDKAIWMGGNFSWNFYHFLYEYAIKFRKLNELNISTDISILIDQICLEVPQFKEIIDILNEKKYPLVGVARNGFFEVGELFYINCPHFIPPNVKDDNAGRLKDIQFDKEGLKELRNFLLPHASSKNFPKRIFLSREKASNWRRFNEEEVFQVCADFGFEVVFPEKLTFCEQMGLFNQAEWIVGGSGAAFTNLLFCNNLCKAVILYKARIPFSGFSTIAQISGANLRYITEETSAKMIQVNSIHDPFKIDVSDFRQYLKENFEIKKEIE